MKTDKKDKFKDLLKHAADDRPAANLTAAVMKTIEADLQREIVLKTLLQKEEATGPSFSFTANVMAGIQASKPQFVYKPIIAKKVWYGIAALFMIFVALIVLPGAGQNASGDQGVAAKLVRYTYAIPPIYSVVMAVAVILMGGDYLLNRTKNKTADTLA
ncbi:MAG: hypothetical protein V4619_14195 [Bacteroidota bacterium]